MEKALCSVLRTNPGDRIDLDEWRKRPNPDAGGTASPKPVTDRADKGKSECQTPPGDGAVLARVLRRNKPDPAKRQSVTLDCPNPPSVI